MDHIINTIQLEQNLTIYVDRIKNMQFNDQIFKIYNHVNFFKGSFSQIMSFRLFILSKHRTKVRHQLNLTYHKKKKVGSMRINVIVIYMIQLFNILVIFLLQESFFKMRARLVHCNDYYMRIRISITSNTLNCNVISITIHQFGNHLGIES